MSWVTEAIQRPGFSAIEADYLELSGGIRLHPLEPACCGRSWSCFPDTVSLPPLTKSDRSSLVTCANHLIVNLSIGSVGPTEAPRMRPCCGICQFIASSRPPRGETSTRLPVSGTWFLRSSSTSRDSLRIADTSPPDIT